VSQKFPHNSLFEAKTVRELDDLAIHATKITSFDLMQRAGESALNELLENYGAPTLLHVFCGAGNNGGDGYVVAAMAAAKNISVNIYEFGEAQRMSEATRKARSLCVEGSAEFLEFSSSCDLSEGFIVDGLIGTGFKGDLKDSFAHAIECINGSFLPILSIDIPSGVCSNTGAVSTSAIKADLTVTFVGAKQGLFTGRGPEFSGDITFDSLDIAESVLQGKSPSAELMSLEDLLELMPDSDSSVHKYQRGHCMTIGGDLGTGGASLLAAQASLKIGSGLSSLATRPEHVSACLVRQPEIMACGVVSGQQLEPLLQKPTVLVVGPGLGRSSWSEQMLQKAMATNLPLVVDADALNIIADGRVVTDFSHRSWVITPHSGEAARLLGITPAEVESDRFSAVLRLQEKYKATIILKGPGTLISSSREGPFKICPYGNNGMATAGMGDILSGIIGGLIAQGMDLQVASELGVCLHSFAADRAAELRGRKGLVATEVLDHLRELLNPQRHEFP
jgi:NAD(P)H-hydrate epimerase